MWSQNGAITPTHCGNGCHRDSGRAPIGDISVDGCLDMEWILCWWKAERYRDGFQKSIPCILATRLDCNLPNLCTSGTTIYMYRHDPSLQHWMHSMPFHAYTCFISTHWRFDGSTLRLLLCIAVSHNNQCSRTVYCDIPLLRMVAMQMSD